MRCKFTSLRFLSLSSVSRRGVVFFRDQDITPEEQKDFTGKIGQLAGKPESSGMHIHPILNAERNVAEIPVDEKGTINKDNTISVISSQGRKAYYSNTFRVDGAQEWHSG